MSSQFLEISIPSYKRPETLNRLLKSIQTEFSIRVSDNGGNLSAEFKNNHKHVNFIAGPEVPVARNWNIAASKTAEWIIMPGDDDLYFPNSFQIIERVLRANPNADIVFFGHHIIDENDNIKESWKPIAGFFNAPYGFEEIKLGVLARPPSIVFRRKMFELLNGFDERFTVTAGDNEFYQRISLIGNTLFFPEIVSGYRVWDNGATKSTIATKKWLHDIDLWCMSIREFSKINTNYVYPRRLQDEIYLSNMRSGIKELKKQGKYFLAWKFVLNSRYPYFSSFKAQIKLFAHLLMPLKK